MADGQLAITTNSSDHWSKDTKSYTLVFEHWSMLRTLQHLRDFLHGPIYEYIAFGGVDSRCQVSHYHQIQCSLE
jgi:hypothetical protein